MIGVPWDSVNDGGSASAGAVRPSGGRNEEDFMLDWFVLGRRYFSLDLRFDRQLARS